MMRIPRTTVVLLAFSALAGCVSLKRTAEPRYFALRPVAGTPPVAASIAPASADVALVVGVLPLALPGHLERPQFVSWIGPDEMRLDQFVRWAEPLASGALRVLANDLADGAPFASGDHGAVVGIGGAAVPRARGRRSLRPAAGWGRRRSPADSCCFPGSGERPLVARAVDLRRPPDPGPRDPARAVEAMSALLADLAAQIAEAVTALPPDTECSEGGSLPRVTEVGMPPRPWTPPARDHAAAGVRASRARSTCSNHSQLTDRERIRVYAFTRRGACPGADVRDHRATRSRDERAQPATADGLPRSPTAPLFMAHPVLNIGRALRSDQTPRLGGAG